MLLPDCGPLPQISHTCAMIAPEQLPCRRGNHHYSVQAHKSPTPLLSGWWVCLKSVAVEEPGLSPAKSQAIDGGFSRGNRALVPGVPGAPPFSPLLARGRASLRRLALRLHRQPGILPGVKSALKRIDVPISALLKLLRQT